MRKSIVVWWLICRTNMADSWLAHEYTTQTPATASEVAVGCRVIEGMHMHMHLLYV
jgi:hypothetical protein